MLNETMSTSIDNIIGEIDLPLIMMQSKSVDTGLESMAWSMGYSSCCSLDCH